MGVIFKTDERRVIPRWRSFEIASLTGELDLTANTNTEKRNRIVGNIKEQKEAWLKSKDLVHAGDLLSSAYVLGMEEDFFDVAQYIVDTNPNEHSPLVKLANRIIGRHEEKTTLPNYEIVQEHGVGQHIPGLKYRQEINTLKNYLRSENRNPIAWIELGRLYTLAGDVKKAQKAIDAALYLDKNNRFIVRSASRFYHHFHQDREIALEIIKRSDYVSTDPWLISAEIAYSGILGRHTKLAKVGQRFLGSANKSAADITELASALGTLEFTNGKIKEARKYFQTSLINPNDNSLAQVSWMSDQINGLDIDVSKYDVPLAFEAKAHEQYDKKNFQKSYESALRWYKDEGYSSRPINLASYIASTFLNKNAEAIQLVKMGLKANPADAMLINNLIYFLLEDNLIEEATRVFSDHINKRLEHNNKASRISFTATTGLLLFRNGNIEEGRSFYQKALSECKKEKNPYLIALATVNLVREEVRIATRQEELTVLLNQLKSACSGVEEPDVQVSYNKVLKDYEAKVRELTN